MWQQWYKKICCVMENNQWKDQGKVYQVYPLRLLVMSTLIL